jgi:hypothetical protein
MLQSTLSRQMSSAVGFLMLSPRKYPAAKVSKSLIFCMMFRQQKSPRREPRARKSKAPKVFTDGAEMSLRSIAISVL